MSKFTIRISNEAELTILRSPQIIEKKDSLLKDMDQSIYARYTEIIYYLNQAPVNELAYKNILRNFEAHFVTDTLEKAIVMAITGEDQYDLKQNMLSLITEKNLDAAIMGRTMINAFIDAISEIPCEDCFDAAAKGVLIFNLETAFNEDTPSDANTLSTSSFKAKVENDEELTKRLAAFAKWLNDDIDD